MTRVAEDPLREARAIADQIAQRSPDSTAAAKRLFDAAYDALSLNSPAPKKEVLLSLSLSRRGDIWPALSLFRLNFRRMFCIHTSHSGSFPRATPRTTRACSVSRPTCSASSWAAGTSEQRLRLALRQKTPRRAPL